MTSHAMARIVKTKDGLRAVPFRPVPSGQALRIAALVTAARQYKAVMTKEPVDPRLEGLVARNLDKAARDIE